MARLHAAPSSKRPIRVQSGHPPRTQTRMNSGLARMVNAIGQVGALGLGHGRGEGLRTRPVDPTVLGGPIAGIFGKGEDFVTRNQAGSVP
jgi:hypothetical protein